MATLTEEQIACWLREQDHQCLLCDPLPIMNRAFKASATCNAEQDAIVIGERAEYKPCPSPERFETYEAATLPRWWEEEKS